MVGKRKISVFVVSFLLVFLFLISIPPSNSNAKAQSYSFQTLREHCDVYIEKDGSIHIEYEFERDHIASHGITEEIERRLEREFGKVTVTIHVEPAP